MSNITNINELWGRRWKFNDVLTAPATSTRIEVVPTTLSKSTPVAKWIDNTGDTQNLHHYYGTVIVVDPLDPDIYQVEAQVTAYQFIPAEEHLSGQDTVTDFYVYRAGKGYYEAGPHILEFVPQLDGCTLQCGASFIPWWNANTTEYTLIEEYQDLFANIASSLRAKMGTSETIKPRYFPSKIDAIEGGSGGITPTGTLEIKSNGDYDVTSYATASVDVPIPEGYIVPEGTITITESGTYNVTNYASAEVSVESGGGGTIDVPEVTNIAIDENGLVSWDAVVMEGYTISYLITINSGETHEVDTNSYDAYFEAVDGDNTIVVITKAAVNADEVSATISYSAPVAEVVKLSTKLVKADYNVPVVADNDQIYVFINKHAYLFNTKDESLTQLTTSSGTFYGQIAVKYGDDIYFFRSSSTIYKYNIANKAFSQTSLSTSQGYPAVGVVGQYVYLLGGYNSKVVQRVDLEALTVTTLSPLATALNAPAGIAVGENIYFTGGYTNSNIYKYNTTNETTETIGSLSEKRLDMAMTVVGSNIFMFGGINEAGQTRYNTILKIDTKTDTITTVEQTLPNNLCRAGATAVGKHSYLFAGETAYNTYSNAIIRASYLK